MSGYTTHSWEFAMNEDDYKKLESVVDELSSVKNLNLMKWLKLAKERHIELGNKIENFDLSDTAMAYFSLGNAIDKAIKHAELDGNETKTNEG